MYKLEINGNFSGQFQTAEEAMEKVMKLAKPFGYKWVIFDKFGKIYSKS